MNLKTVTFIVAILCAITFLGGIIELLQMDPNSWQFYQKNTIKLVFWIARIISDGGISIFLFTLYSKQK
jgi:hypothetical protein